MGRAIQGIPFIPGYAEGRVHWGLKDAGRGDIIIVRQQELRPLHEAVAGLVVIDGVPLSHPLIHMLGLGIPTILAREHHVAGLAEGEMASIDGNGGLLTTGDSALGRLHAEAPEPPPAGSTVETSNGEAVFLRASVSSLAGVVKAMACGAVAIGSLRSEFLTPADGRQPDRNFFEQQLTEIGRVVHSLPVTVRLPDFVADKRPAWLGEIPGMEGPLGLHGPRLYGIEPVRSVLRAVVEAIGTLAPSCDLSILVPYIVERDEFLRWRRLIEDFLPIPVAIGAMAETPAAVLGLRELMAAADFVAIGCNDLMQCVFGADRDIPQVAGFLDPYSPVLLRLLRLVATEAGEEAGRIQLCGLLPQMPGILPVLLGFGYRTFSVEPVLIPYLARTVRGTDSDLAEALAAGACAVDDADGVRDVLGIHTGAGWSLGARP